MTLGRIADYELLEPLGRGGMGIVFKARHPRLDHLVALKVLPGHLTSSPEHRARFLREARAEAGLSHSSIARCFDVGEAPPIPPDLLDPGSAGPHPAQVLYLSMEYVPGTDLQELVAGPPLAIDRVLDLGIQIAVALEVAHAAGIVHRDLKPTNVRVTPEGEVKVLDFGLARVLEPPPSPDGSTISHLTSSGRVMGTASYMAPEQAHGKPVDERSDLFSLGVILFQLVTGRLPFTGNTDLEVFYAAANEEPPPLARYATNPPAELERIVRKLLAKQPSRRYQSAHEVRTDLERLRQEVHGVVRRRRALPGRVIAVAAGLLLVAFAALLVWQRMALGSGQSLAIMPFRNVTGDPGLEYLGEGIASDVLARLVSGSRLNVASLSSTTALSRSNATTEAVAKELGVQAVLEGSLRREAENTVLEVSLVDGRRGFVRWMNRYEYSLSNLLEIEHDIANQVSRRLAGGPSGPAPAGTQPRTLSAYALYLRAGASLEDLGDPRGADRAAELYQRALDRDPDFALGWAGRSRALWKIWSRDKTPAILRNAEEAADRAVQLDPHLLEARVARAQIYRATSRYKESIRELEAVLQVNPNWDEALLHLAASQRDAGDLPAAEVTLRRAVLIRPSYWRNWNSLGALLVRRGDYAGAAQAFQQVMRLTPDKNLGYSQAAAMDLLQGNYSAAIETYEKLPAPVQDATLASNIGSAYFYERRLDEARRYYRFALTLEPREPTWWINLGDLQMRAGAADSARASYAQAVRLDEELLHVDPSSPERRRHHAVALAKAGDCAAAEAELARIPSAEKTRDSEAAHVEARIQALCGGRVRTLAAIRLAIQLGVPPRTLRDEDEFTAFARDPEFQSITASKP